MTKGHKRAGVSALARTRAAAHLHWRALRTTQSRRDDARSRHANDCVIEQRLVEYLHLDRPLVRRLVYGGGAVAALTLVAVGALWWRLTSGPVALDVATPWLTSAVEERLGGGHRIEVGGTQLERDDDGRTALRLRDIVVRDATGSIVANAPKAEVGLSGTSLLVGHVRATRLSLIGATMSVRVEPDGQVNVFTGGDAAPPGTEHQPVAARPVIAAIPQGGVVRAVTPIAPAPGGAASAPGGVAEPAGHGPFAALLAWLDGLDALGFDGRELTEVGLKNGALVVDDRRNGKHWNFKNINFSLTRPREGGVAFAVTSTGTDGPWSLTATVAPRGEGRRAIEAVVRDVSPKDILLALRADNDTLDADVPISAIVRAEIGADGTLHMAEGRVIGGAGFISASNAPGSRVQVDEAQLEISWNAAKRVLHLPFELRSGSNRLNLVAHVQAPPQPGETWNVMVSRGMLTLGATERTREPPLVIDRVAMRARFDPVAKKLILDHGELRSMAAGVAFSGAVDFADDARLQIGMAATRMTVVTLKRLWPVFIVPPLRQWIIDHFTGGTIERLDIATNAPWNTLKPGGPPTPDDGLSGEIAGTATLRPVDTLPAIRDADLVARFTGRTATVTLGRGTVELPSGRKIAVSNGTFEVADTAAKPPSARVKLRLDGPAEAAIELAGMEPLRSAAGLQMDAATTRGAVNAQLALSLPLGEMPSGSVTYNFDAEVTNFSAEKLVRGLKAEAPILRVNASPQGFRVNGDARIGNALVAVDYRKRPDGDAEARAQTVLDDAARSYLGFELGGALTGPIPIKFNGKIAAVGDNRFAVDADLTQVKVADLLPGWNKAAGKPARATFVLIERPQSRRIEDLSLEGSGARMKGMIELDGAGELVQANFPTFALSDGDKAAVKAERGNDGTLKVQVRGDVYDGRGFIKSMAAGPTDPNAPKASYDLDLDVKLGTIAGFHGEALRGLDVRLSRRAGQIRSLAMNARIGLDAQLSADLRGRSGRQTIHLESSDAGALFRFTDMYARIYGGRMWVDMEPPGTDQAPKDGLLNITQFAVRGESALDRIASSAPPPDSPYRSGPAARSGGVEFTRMRVDFTRSPGRLSIREGNVLGMSVCATMDGTMDFQREDVRLRGTFIPACALNNMPTQIPVLGYFLGGPKEGLLGVTYEVVGPPNNMTLRVNPVSAVAPGFLRKFFEFRHNDENILTGETPRPRNGMLQ
jgi:hypothetical protein